MPNVKYFKIEYPQGFARNMLNYYFRRITGLGATVTDITDEYEAKPHEDMRGVDPETGCLPGEEE